MASAMPFSAALRVQSTRWSWADGAARCVCPACKFWQTALPSRAQAANQASDRSSQVAESRYHKIQDQRVPDATSTPWCRSYWCAIASPRSSATRDRTLRGPTR